MPEQRPIVYSAEQIEIRIKEVGLDAWYLEDGWLRRKYNTDGWPTTLMLTNAIGYLCEAAWHHADLAVTWGKVWVKLKTHSAGGVTNCPRCTSEASAAYAPRNTRALSRSRGASRFARPRGLPTVKRAASVLARSSSRSTLRSSSRSGRSACEVLAR